MTIEMNLWHHSNYYCVTFVAIFIFPKSVQNGLDPWYFAQISFEIELKLFWTQDTVVKIRKILSKKINPFWYFLLLYCVALSWVLVPSMSEAICQKVRSVSRVADVGGGVSKVLWKDSSPHYVEWIINPGRHDHIITHYIPHTALQLASSLITLHYLTMEHRLWNDNCELSCTWTWPCTVTWGRNVPIYLQCIWKTLQFHQ